MKFAFVTPRYGADVSGGAEHACRLLAEQLCERHDVEVLTSCARDPRSWSNAYSEGTDRVRGALVRRFAVSQPHERGAFLHYTDRLLGAPHGRGDEIEWSRRLGPALPGLLDHLKRQHRQYDAIVFFSMWHPATVQGLSIAPERSIVFPYLQLRRELRFPLWKELLSLAGGVAFVSGWERTLLQRYIGVNPPHQELVGVGIDTPHQQMYPRHQQDPADSPEADDVLPAPAAETEEEPYLEGRGVPFRRRHRLYGDFALYGGRIEPDNGCEEMLEYFHRHAEEHADSALVLLGVKMMKVPDAPYLQHAGVLPERERMVAYEAASVTLAPDSDDLLALPLLESLAVGTPVLASAGNPAAVEHCRRANAGLYYASGEEFTEALALLEGNPALREKLGENGRTYVRQHFSWEPVLNRFERLVSRLKTR